MYDIGQVQHEMHNTLKDDRQNSTVNSLINRTRSIWKMLGPFATASRRTPPVLHCYCRTPPLLHTACASMSTTCTTTTTYPASDSRHGHKNQQDQKAMQYLDHCS